MSSLTNNIIISTRPLVENDAIKNHLKAKGACVLDFPMIKTVGVGLDEKLKSILNQVDKYEWIVFTSKNGVINFYQ